MIVIKTLGWMAALVILMALVGGLQLILPPWVNAGVTIILFVALCVHRAASGRGGRK